MAHLGNTVVNGALRVIGGENVDTINGVTVGTSPKFTDASVTQTATTTDANYEILFSATADNTTRTEGARKTTTLRFNPNKGALMEGDSTAASGSQSHAEGYYTAASGNQSHAEGNYTTASGVASHAEGYNTKASGAEHTPKEALQMLQIVILMPKDMVLLHQDNILMLQVNIPVLLALRKQ